MQAGSRYLKLSAGFAGLFVVASTVLVSLGPPASATAKHAKLRPHTEPACTKTWNAASANWGTSTDWSPSGTPGSSDVVCIDNGSTVQITSSISVANIQLSDSSTLEVSAGSNTDSGDLTIDATSTLWLDSGNGGEIQVDGNLFNDGTVTGESSDSSAGGANLKVADFTNDGTLEELSPGGGTGDTTLVLDTDSPSGPEGGGNSLYTNDGTVLVSGGGFELNNSVTFTMAGGTFENQGTLSAQGGITLNLTAGSIASGGSNTALSLNGTMTVNYPSTSTSCSGVTGTTGDVVDNNGDWTLGGDVPPSSTLDVSAQNGSTDVTLSGDTTNCGTLILDAGPSGSGNTSSIYGSSSDVLTNASGSTIDVNSATANGTHDIQPTFLNAGTLDATSGSSPSAGTLTLGSSGSTTTNEGTIDVSAGSIVNFADNSSFVQQAGTITNNDGTFGPTSGATGVSLTFFEGSATGTSVPAAGSSITTLNQPTDSLIFDTGCGSSCFTGTISSDAIALSGTIPSGVVLNLGYGATSPTVTVASSTTATNDGTVVMDDADLEGAGTFVNGSGGTVTTTGEGTGNDTTGFGNDIGVSTFTNDTGGTVSVSTGDTLTFTAAPTNLSSGTLTGGTWTGTGNGNLVLPSDITTDAATIDLPSSVTVSTSGTSNDAEIASLADVTAGGTLSLSGGDSLTTTGGLTDAGTVDVGGSSSQLSVTGTYTQIAGSTTLADSTAKLTATSVSITGGTFGGIGSVSADVTNTSGTVEPDNAGVTGTLAVSGTYTQASGGTLSVRVDGATASSDYDVLSATGAATVGGTVDVTTGDGFDPAGDTFNILSGSSLTGTFSTVTSLTAGADYSAAYSSTTASLNGRSPSSGAATQPPGPPAVSSITPSSGPASGGNDVTVNGTNLENPTAVMFGTTPAAEVFSLGPTSILVVAPPGVGEVAVTVSTTIGTSAANAATMYSYSPDVTAISPADGLGSGGTTVTVSGGGFVGATAVDFGQIPAASFSVVSGSEITAVSPAGTGSVDVTVTTPAGTSPAVPADQFTYVPLLFTSNPDNRQPDGNTDAVWTTLLPAPGAGDDTGLTQPVEFGVVYFDLSYTAGEHVLLSSDLAGSDSFCVQGSWTLDVSGPTGALASPPTGSSSTGTDCSGKPLDLASLDLPTGIYGFEMDLDAPATGTQYGSSDVYLLTPAGSPGAYDFAQGIALAGPVVGGSDTIQVGQSGSFPMTITEAVQPVTGVIASFDFDPDGISVDEVASATGWCCNAASSTTGTALFEETGPPIGSGGTIGVVTASCLESGMWTIGVTESTDWGYVGIYSYQNAIRGQLTVTCSPPPPAPAASAVGVTIDPSDGSALATIIGSGLGAATSASLVDADGAVVATTSTVSVDSTGTALTATFASAAPGIDDLEVMSATGSVIARTSGGTMVVPPALPFFSAGSPDTLPDTPGYPTTHLFRVSNLGTVDGVAIVAFGFPQYFSPEPQFDGTSSSGQELLLHGLTQDGWVEYVAVPVDAGSTTDVAFTETLPPSAVFGSEPSVTIGNAVPHSVSVVGQYTSGEWSAVDSGSAQSIVDRSFGTASNDFVTALNTISSLGGSVSAQYMSDISSLPLSGPLTAMMPSLLDQAVMGNEASSGALVTDPQPQIQATSEGIAPPGPSSSVSTSSGLDDPMAAFMGMFSFDTTEAIQAGFEVDSVNDLNAHPSAAAPYVVGSPSNPLSGGMYQVGVLEQYDTGGIATTIQFLPGQGSNGLESVSAGTAEGTPEADGIDPSSWVAGVTQAVDLGNDQTVAGIPFVSSGSLDFQTVSSVGGTTTFGLISLNGYQPVVVPSSPPSSTALRSFVPTGSQYNPPQGYFPPPGKVTPTQWQDELCLPSMSNYSLLGSSLSIVLGFATLGATPVVSGLASAVDGSVNGAFNQTTGALGFWSGVIGFAIGGPVGAGIGAGLGIALGNALTQSWTISICESYLSARDPNSMTVSPSGSASDGYVNLGSGQALTYMIHFQNDPTAGAPARNIRVTAQLDPNLDPSTLVDGPSSYGATAFSYDPSDRTMTWLLSGIDLPPDTSPPDGEGYVSFSAEPSSGTASGAKISEDANVFFDFNPPVETNTATVTIDSSRPTTSVDTIASQPAGTTSVPISWTSSSTAGISSYTVFVSVDGGPLTPVATVTPASTAATGDSYTLPVTSDTFYWVGVAATDLGGLTTSPVEPQVSFGVSQEANGITVGGGTSSVGVSALGVAFGDELIGSTATRSVTITDSGTSDLTMSSATVSQASGPSARRTKAFTSSAATDASASEGAFAISDDGCSGTTLVSSGTCTITVSFTPSSAQSYSGSLVITDSAGGSPQTIPLSGNGVSVAATTAGSSYRFVAADGGIFDFGSSGFFGSTGSIRLNKPVVGMAATPDGKGYWLVASDGGVFTFGDAGFYGSAGNVKLDQPIVGMAATPDGKGYWLVASDGGVFTFGDAGYYGSLGGSSHVRGEDRPGTGQRVLQRPRSSTSPVVAIVRSPSGKGYWLVDSAGDVYSYGNAAALSLAASPTSPIVGAASTPSGGGLWLAAADGGVLPVGNATDYGSAYGTALAQPIAGIASTSDGGGYWLVGADGGVFTFGDAQFLGSTGGTHLNQPIVGIEGA